MRHEQDSRRPEDSHGLCAYSDAVLALLLDGESGDQLLREQGWEREVTASELAHHRRECARCTETIARARRLDALLAGATELEFDAKAADELLAKVMATERSQGMPAVMSKVMSEVEPVETAAVASVPQRHGLRTTLVAACLMLLGFFAGSRFWNEETVSPKTESPKTESSKTVSSKTVSPKSVAVKAVEPNYGSPLRTRTVATASPESRLDPGMTRLPDRSMRPVTRSSATKKGIRLEALTPRRLLTIAQGSERFRTGAKMLGRFASASSLPGLWRSCRSWSAISDSILEQSLAKLVSSNHQQASSTVITALATWPDGPALNSLLALARGRTRLQTQVTRRMDDPMVLRAATRLGGRELDRRLRSLGGSSPRSIPAMVDALSSLAERPGRVALMLDLWEDLDRKGGDRDDLNLAREWFAPLPFASGRELRDEFTRSRRASRREHCLLALAAQAGPRQSEFLLRTVAGPRLPESELAAYALGQLPVDGDDLHEQFDGSRRSYLLLAALACREDPRLSRIIERMELTQEEAMFLEAGVFTLEQFTIAASLFRNRRGLVGL